MLVLTVALAIAAGCLLAPRLAGAESEPRTVPEAGSEAELRKLFDSAVNATPKESSGRTAPMWQMALTTWLPNEWAPSPRTIWTRYAYGLDVALDGASGVSAPIARLERGSRLKLIPMAGKLTRIGTHGVRPHGGWKYTADDEKRVLQQALALVGEPTKGARGSIGIGSYFQSWKLGHEEIAEHVAPNHRAFFEWLKKMPEPGGAARGR